MYCPKCGAYNPDDAKFCSKCGAPLGAITPENTGTPATESPAGTVKYAGFWIRFLAAIIDGIILDLIFIVIFGITGLFTGSTTSTANIEAHMATMEISYTFASIISWLYYALLQSSSWQATVGKRVLGLKVTDLQGNRISFGRATIRYFSKILSALILMIGFIMAGFTEKKQALHDKIAGTVVVKR